MGGPVSYRDAITVLGGDPPMVAALDRLLTGALSVATGGVSDKVLEVFTARGRMIGYGRDLIRGARDRVRGTGRVDRTRRLAAAHTAVVITAYFEALDEIEMPFSVDELRLTREDQLRLASAATPARELLDALLDVGPPVPAPHLPYEQFLRSLKEWYRALSTRLLYFVEALAVWDALTDSQRNAFIDGVVTTQLPRAAVRRFEELYAQLLVEVPELGLWSARLDHQATRAVVHTALARVEELFTAYRSGGDPTAIVRALANANRAALARPILSDGTAAGGLQPSLEEGYLDPDFRVRSVTGADRPADEDWWADTPVRCDLPEYLAGALTSVAGALAPLVVLGQPGGGKSALTRVLAARLPAADFLAVRVVLRDVPADADIQDQIEYAVRDATGERASWPDLARSTGGALTVVLLDGFDELLQATGVSQSDYLIRVGRFQQREADQGRPVAVIVTSRIAVADRARYPDGAVAVRLEPFRSDQIAAWLRTWNQRNTAYWQSTGLRPVPYEVVSRQPTLASQPLLLLMLALYDAENNALQRVADADATAPLDETTLYEQLLRTFAVREVTKSAAALPDHQADLQVERELQRLSLVAFGVTNRGRQWITDAELQADFTALFGPRSTPGHDLRAPLNEADRTLGRFFFIQRAQAVRDDRRLQTYEFLHATFAEYLLARLTVRLVSELLTQRSALAVGPVRIDDDLLYALLSWAPLSSRQILHFVRGCAAQEISATDHPRLTMILIDMLSASTNREDYRHSGYRPRPLPVSSRHGIYSANLVILALAVNPSVTASMLFPDDPDPAGRWHRQALLWRSSLNEQAWTELALAMSVRYTWTGNDRDLVITLTTDAEPKPTPVDLQWHYGNPPDDEHRGDYFWRRPYIDEQMHKMAVTGGTNDAILRHTVEPLVEFLNPTVMTFLGHGHNRTASAAHELLRLWLTSALGTTTELVTAYERCHRLLTALTAAEPRDEYRSAHIVMLHQLTRDAARLPTALVSQYLTVLLRAENVDPRTVPLVIDVALAMLPAAPGDTQRDHLHRTITQAFAAMRTVSPPADLITTLVSIDAHGLLTTPAPGESIIGEPAVPLLGQLLNDSAHDLPPHILNRARQIVTQTTHLK